MHSRHLSITRTSLTTKTVEPLLNQNIPATLSKNKFLFNRFLQICLVRTFITLVSPRETIKCSHCGKDVLLHRLLKKCSLKMCTSSSLDITQHGRAFAVVKDKVLQKLIYSGSNYIFSGKFTQIEVEISSYKTLATLASGDGCFSKAFLTVSVRVFYTVRSPELCFTT